MSASVATAAVGLLDRSFTPPADPRDSRVVEWQDRMEVDRSSRDQSVDRQSEPTDTKIKRSLSDTESGNERRNALTGLLAALATTTTSNSNEVDVLAPSNVRGRAYRSVTPPQDSPISIASPQPRTGTSTPPENKAHANDTSVAHIIATASNANETDASNTVTNNVSHDTVMGLIEPFNPMTFEYTQIDSHALASTSLDNIPIPAFEMPSDVLPTTPPPHSSPVNIKRQYDAFARLEFDDGIFYLNTYQCELGRDQHAYHMALRREREAQEAAESANHRPTESSRGRASQISNIIKAESQIQESVVSEAGGFAGVDEQPVEGYGPNHSGQSGRSRGSRSSDASIVRPADVLHNPSLHTPFDYNKEASRQLGTLGQPEERPSDEDEQPAPVTADHLPDPNSCPLIPIHVTSESETTELDGLKAISRRHMKIFWSWEKSSFMLEILGRNGAFLEGEFVAPADVVPLYTGATIQISSVNFVFRLPHVEDASPSVADSGSNMGEPLEESLTNISETSESGQRNSLKLRLNIDGSGSQAMATNGESKRRGPGRPPKDGVMSQRERKEREKADKEAKTRALNGEPSPPLPQRKPSKSQLPKPEPVLESAKTEKRKYNKRKREDGEEEQVLPSIEAVDETPVVETPQPQPVAKKARTKSYSPPYKPKEECSQADLTRPAHNYAVLLYQVLSQTGEISLRQIYKEMQSRWPFFKYMVESDGWTSSVRHNLNQEVGKLFVKGRKEGKGYTWLAKPNAMEEYQAQKNKRSNAPTVPRPRVTAPTRANFAPNQGQQLTWQNSGPAPQNGTSNALGQPGQWSGPQNQNRPNQPGSQINGQPQIQGHNPNSQASTNNVPDPEGPAPPHMIVTFLGVRIIDHFENTMMGQLRQRYRGEEDKMTRWANVFRSARARCLNGSPASSLPEGETEDERTIMTHINNFVTMYKNPAFRGFFANPQTPNVGAPNSTSPAPNLAMPGASTSIPIPATNGLRSSTSMTTNTNPDQQAPLSGSTPKLSSDDTHSHPQPSMTAIPGANVAATSANHPAEAISGTSPSNISGAVPATTFSIPAPLSKVSSEDASGSAPTTVVSSDAAAATQIASSSAGSAPVSMSQGTTAGFDTAQANTVSHAVSIVPGSATSSTNNERDTLELSGSPGHNSTEPITTEQPAIPNGTTTNSTVLELDKSQLPVEIASTTTIPDPKPAEPQS